MARDLLGGFQLILLTQLFISVLSRNSTLMYATRPAEELCTTCAEGYITKSGSCILPTENKDLCIHLKFGKDSINVNLTAEFRNKNFRTMENITDVNTDNTNTIRVCQVVDDDNYDGDYEYECYTTVWTTSINFVVKWPNAEIYLTCSESCPDCEVKFSFLELKKCKSDADCGEGQNVACTNNFCGCKEGYEGEECSELTGCKDLKAVCEKFGSECISDGDSTDVTCRCNDGMNFDKQTKECRIADISEDDTGSLREYWYSYVICFKSSANGKLMHNCGDNFTDFRTSFISTTQKIFNKTIEEKEVKLDRCYQDEQKTFMSFLLQVENNGTAFSRAEIRSIIEEMAGSGYNVSRCDYNIAYLAKPESSGWIYAILPIFALFGLMMWAWKQNVFAQKCRPEYERKEVKLSIKPQPSEPNTYETRPKQGWTDEQARPEALLPRPLQEGTRDRGETARIEMNSISSSIVPTDVLSIIQNKRKSKRRPSLENFKVEVEVNNRPSGRRIEGNEVDHVYDSVAREVMDEKETKL